MSEGDVSLIHDEDVLRRMWQQTEDFSRKKEIRAHMYRLREERLRNLYSPEPHARAEQKGCEFTSTQGHVKSFADQTFQSMKSKEVRDAGSPPKEFTYHGQDLKALSNAGWNVESENKTTDDGHTHVKSVHANIEGRYDVEGGKGQFAAVDQHKQAVTEYQDENTSMKRNKSSTNTAAREQVVRQTDDGTQIASTTSSSSSTSKFHQTSSKRETVPYLTNDDYDQSQQTTFDTNRNEQFATKKHVTNDFEQSLRKNDFETGELESRKVEYPDDNTKIVVETRCLPDGTRVTSTRREFRAPVVQNCRSEQHSQQSRSSNRSTHSTSQQRSDIRETSKIIQDTFNDHITDIVDSQRHADDYDFKTNQQTEYLQTADNRGDRFTQTTESHIEERYHEPEGHDPRVREHITSKTNQNYKQHDIQETENIIKEKEERTHNIATEKKIEESTHKKTSSDQYLTTYQHDFTQKNRVSNDWNPSHQAWASTLRSDTPTLTRPSTRASSPGGRTYQSSNSSLRSSVSPEKSSRKPPSRGGSPSKIDRYSPTRTTSDKYSSSHSTYSVTDVKTNRYNSPERRVPPTSSPTRARYSPDKKPQEGRHQRPSVSPDQRDANRSSVSPDRKPTYRSSPINEISKINPVSQPGNQGIVQRPSASPERKSIVNTTTNTGTKKPEKATRTPSASPERKPASINNYSNKSPKTCSPTRSPQDKVRSRPSHSPDKKPAYQTSVTSETFNDFSSITSKEKSTDNFLRSTSPTRPLNQCENPKRPSLEKVPNDYQHKTFPSQSCISLEKHPTEYPAENTNIEKSPVTDLRDKSPTKFHPTRPSPSPERKTGYQKSDFPSNTSRVRSTVTERISPIRNSVSPDNKPGYMKPTAVTQQSPNIFDKSPNRQVTSQSPERKPNEKSVTKIQQDHFKFVDEETKVYKNTDYDTRHTITGPTPISNPDIREKSPLAKKQSSHDVTDYCKPDSHLDAQPPTLRKGSRSPSPSKGPVTFKQHLINIETTETLSSSIDNISRDYNEYTDVSNYEIPNNKNFPKETSPSKFGTYDKKQRISQDMEETVIAKTKDTKYNSLTRREKSSSPKKTPESPMSPSKKTLRDSTSPFKAISRDSKYKQTTDFVSKERTSEDITKFSKEHPRQLVTPSTSPTRKAKTFEPEPSTGQSSPTTSVSGFVYFSSPRIDNNIVTDLDDQESYSKTDRIEEITSYMRPESLNVNTKRSPSPSKIPCRSPAQDKHTSPTTDSLPRKSSLKKPSTNNNIVSPIEKPPSSFQVSPTVEIQGLPEHKVVKKDDPIKLDTDSSEKIKPPLKRRETYDERCRKILGMADDQTMSQSLESNNSSPSVSPCRSPKERSPNREYRKDTTDTHIKVTDFITQEKENIMHTRDDNITHGNKSKIPSRGGSPTKVQTDTTTTTYDETSTSDVYENITATTENKHSITKHNNENISESLHLSSPKEHNVEKKLIESHPKNKAPSKTKPSCDRNPENKKSDNKQPSSPERPQTDSPRKTTKDNQTKQISKPNKEPLTINIDKHTETSNITTKRYDKNSRTQDSQESITSKTSINRPSPEPSTHKIPIKPSNTIIKPAVSTNQPLEPKNSRTPSPNKTGYTKIMKDNTSFISSEREQEILNRVQQSLRKLSPKRNERSPSRERSPSKTTTSLQDLDIITTTSLETVTKNINEEEITNNLIDSSKTLKKDDKMKEPKVSSKPPSRNVSPVKKPSSVVSTTNVNKTLDSLTKSRSISPKKSVSSERPQSPQVTRVSGIKPRETIPSHLTQKPTARPLSPTKADKTVNTTDNKKIVKQNSFSKVTKITGNKNVCTPTSKNLELESKRMPINKVTKENTSSKVDNNNCVTRTHSDVSLKHKRPSPQRIKSKPEIKVNDVSASKTKQINSTISKTQKTTTKEPHTKLPNKPKSATALNTSTDDDDVIIDVQLAKSSRENSPDRICPTPIGFNDDIGTPRFPDEVSEPDDDFRKRTHLTIHETESIVDDIVEIREDDELFVKRASTNDIIEADESLLSVNDKVSKFTREIETMNKPKQSTMEFKETECRTHTDFISDNLESDECLLSVSEKVNKFAKGPRGGKDNRSPSRRIVDEYDKNTIYQDDYTKLSVNDKAHLFVETAEHAKTPKTYSTQKIERPDMSNIDESLKSDDCLLSVSDKVHKFVKTAEQFLNETVEVEEKEKKIKEQHDKVMRELTENETYVLDQTISPNQIETTNVTIPIQKNNHHENTIGSFAKETASSQAKLKNYTSSNLKPTEKVSPVKITLRGNVAVKQAKALFENIASNQKNKDVTLSKTTKLTDIGVIKKSPKTDSTFVLHPSLENSPNITDVDSEIDAVHHIRQESTERIIRDKSPHLSRKDRQQSPSQLCTQSPEVPRNKSPMGQVFDTTTKTAFSKHPVIQRIESPTLVQLENGKPEKSQDKVPGYLRPTKTSQYKEETKVVEETEVSSRRGSGKFGVELRRTSVERSSASSERRRSVDHHQPCIEDIFDLDLLEQMLEKVVSYEQRRRIRAQIRVAKKKVETDTVHTKSIKQNTSNNKSPERHLTTPDIKSKSLLHKSQSPERQVKTGIADHHQTRESYLMISNEYTKGQIKEQNEKRSRPQSPEKRTITPMSKAKSPLRQPSPEKKTRPLSPSKAATPKSKQNRFNEYASAYMKKVGLKDGEKTKVTDIKIKKTPEIKLHKTLKQTEEHKTQSIETKQETTIMSRNVTERTSSRDTIEVVHINGKRTPSPDKKQSPERIIEIQTEKGHRRSSSPVVKRQKSDITKKETIVKPVYDGVKKIQPKHSQEEKPSWVTNRNLKKITETRAISTKKIEPEKPKYRAPSPSKVISKPIDVITSSYGPGPLDSNGKPLFGIKALRNGATNYQVKGTVIRQEFHSRNGGEPEGTVSVTAYSNEPEELERLLQVQGERPSRMHGLAAITTTKKFGGETGTTMREAHTKEERAALEQFTHSDRRVTQRTDNIMNRSFDNQENVVVASRIDDKFRGRRIEEKRDKSEDRWKRSEDIQQKTELKQERTNDRRERIEKREDKKTVRQSSVKSLTEKYIKSASETSKSERVSYPKAGLILRTATMKDSVSSDSSAHAGLARTDSDHSLASVEDVMTTTTTERGDGRTVTTTTTTRRSQHGEEKSFLDSSTKVKGVQDILTRMKNADIVIQEGDTTEDSEARALLNKFLGATVLMAGMQNYVTEKPTGKLTVKQETVRSSGGKVTTERSVQEIDIEQCWDERVLRKLLDECSDYEQRRRLRARLRTLMAEQEACASAVTEALAAAGEVTDGLESNEAREEEKATTVTSSVRRNSSEKTVSSSTTTKTSKVSESVSRPAPKTVSPFAKFRQLEKQNSVNSPNSPKTPQSPGSPSQPYFKFTDPAVHASALTIKERLLQWCRDKTRDYENVKLENFSTSWADGLAFCALVHHFLPNTFDYSKLTPEKRRHNFTLAFKVADEKAGIYPLLDVDDMVAMRKPDWKCVFTYVQSIHRRFKDQD
ncbi:uncharacterized protein ACR2FA_008191 isoform 2-T2 [Aphomia sociella]